MSVAERTWSVMVPHHAHGAQQARHRLATELAELLAPSLLANVISVVAELVGNAVRHAGPLPGDVVWVAWRIREHRGDSSVEIRVTDGGASKLPQPRKASPDET